MSRRKIDLDNPPLTMEFVKGMRPIKQTDPEFAAYLQQKKMGRPPVENPKVVTSFRLDADVMEALRKIPNRSARVNALLREMLNV